MALSYLRKYLLVRAQIRSKRRFSKFPGEPGCNQECACGLEQRFDDVSEPVVAQAKALVLQQPGVGALDRPAALAQARAMRLATLADTRLGAAPAAQVTVALGVVSFVGKGGPDPGLDDERGPEQALEQQGLVDVGSGGSTGHRQATSVDRDVVFGSRLRQPTMLRIAAGRWD